jgi:hypothetical protein
LKRRYLIEFANLTFAVLKRLMIDEYGVQHSNYNTTAMERQATCIYGLHMGCTWVAYGWENQISEHDRKVQGADAGQIFRNEKEAKFHEIIRPNLYVKGPY